MALRDVVIKDLSWKLFSLALAVALWFTIRALSRDSLISTRPLEPRATYTFPDLPVLVVSAAADVREFNVNPSAVLVVVSGPPEEMTRLRGKEIHPVVDLTGIEAAVDLKKRVDVSAPPGVTVVRVVPAEVDVVVPPKPRK